MSEWGNPAPLGNQRASPAAECIGRQERTRGTETSKYPEERKSTETPSVAASESGTAHGFEPYVVVTSTERSGMVDHSG
jgi:hypothetical protein